MRVVVVYVHGLWLPGGESFLLRRRLSRALGAESRLFSYPSVSASIIQNALALGDYLQGIPADTLHLVAHSMGGLVVLRLFELGVATRRPAVATRPAGIDDGVAALPQVRSPLVLPPGRIVLIGSPVRGSRSAQRLMRLPLGKAILGVAAVEGLAATCERRWAGARDLGVIAGDRGIGLGRLLGRIREANDGTVLVEETTLPGAVEQLRLHVSHSGMVFSATVARQTAAFLRDGRFARR